MFPFHTSLETAIISLLQKGPLPTDGLLSQLRSIRVGTTKQGMYAALRKLVRAEIALKTKREIALSATWLTKLENFSEIAGHFYAERSRSGSFLALKDGERITYTFKNANDTDAFWIHVLLLLVDAYPGMPFIAYNPHCWFFLVRAESERTLRDAVVRSKGQYLVAVRNRTPLDKQVLNEFDGKNSQYYMHHVPLYPQSNYYVNVIDDYIIEVWEDLQQSAAFERIYARAKAMTPDVEDALREIITARGRSKLIISRNAKRAHALCARLSKPFALQKLSRVGEKRF